MLRRVPLLLVISRAALGPVLIAAAVLHPISWVFGSILCFAFISDIFDGQIARRFQVATPLLRRLDSVADTIFYLSAGIAAWILFPTMIESEAPVILGLIGIEVARYVFDAFKFGREASYHMWSAKLWGIVLFITFFAIFVLKIEGGLMIRLAALTGLFSDLEGLIISLILPEWRHDVPTAYHAFVLRREFGPRSTKCDRSERTP